VRELSDVVGLGFGATASAPVLLRECGFAGQKVRPPRVSRTFSFGPRFALHRVKYGRPKERLIPGIGRRPPELAVPRYRVEAVQEVGGDVRLPELSTAELELAVTLLAILVAGLVALLGSGKPDCELRTGS